MNWAITVGTRVLVILGYLGAPDSSAIGGEAVGSLSLALLGVGVAAVLLYVALSGAPVTRLSRRWR